MLFYDRWRGKDTHTNKTNEILCYDNCLYKYNIVRTSNGMYVHALTDIYTNGCSVIDNGEIWCYDWKNRSIVILYANVTTVDRGTQWVYTCMSEIATTWTNKVINKLTGNRQHNLAKTELSIATANRNACWRCVASLRFWSCFNRFASLSTGQVR
jgi:hypothetical protein